MLTKKRISLKNQGKTGKKYAKNKKNKQTYRVYIYSYNKGIFIRNIKRVFKGIDNEKICIYN